MVNYPTTYYRKKKRPESLTRNISNYTISLPTFHSRHFKTNSINAAIKRLSVDEQSGFELRKLSLKVIANNKGMKIENFAIEMPGTEMKMDTIRMEYDSLKATQPFCR